MVVMVAGLALSAACSGPAAPRSSSPPSSTAEPTVAPTADPASPASSPATGATGTAGPAGVAGAALPDLPEPRPGVCTVPTNGEMRGTGTLWALFFLRADDPSTAAAGREAKIVWKMAGTGDITFTATGPGGVTTTPTWGPEGHGGSTWQRPGREVGTGWLFPTPGCWTITATRTTAETGKLWLAVG